MSYKFALAITIIFMSVFVIGFLLLLNDVDMPTNPDISSMAAEVEYDGCEYVTFLHYVNSIYISTSTVHKSNCKYCINRRQNFKAEEVK